MTYIVSITAHTDTADEEEVVAAIQAAVDLIPGAISAHVAGSVAGWNPISRSLTPTPAPAEPEPVDDPEVATDPIPDDSSVG